MSADDARAMQMAAEIMTFIQNSTDDDMKVCIVACINAALLLTHAESFSKTNNPFGDVSFLKRVLDVSNAEIVSRLSRKELTQ